MHFNLLRDISVDFYFFIFVKNSEIWQHVSKNQICNFTLQHFVYEKNQFSFFNNFDQRKKENSQGLSAFIYFRK